MNGPKHVEARTGEKSEDFQNADLTMTMITTEKGKTILVEHDVMTPRPYNRMVPDCRQRWLCRQVSDPAALSEGQRLDQASTDYQNLGREVTYSGDRLKAILEDNRNPILTPELEALAKQVGGHGGMDFIMDYRLVYCLRNGLPLDILCL